MFLDLGCVMDGGGVCARSWDITCSLFIYDTLCNFDFGVKGNTEILNILLEGPP